MPPEPLPDPSPLARAASRAAAAYMGAKKAAGPRRRGRPPKGQPASYEPVAATLSGFDWSGFPEWAAENVVIQDKLTLSFVHFKLNKLQLRAFANIQDQWRRKGFIRQNWLKHRRWGGSILVQALCFYLARKVPGVECLLMAHRSDASTDVFRRAQLMDQHCTEPPPARLIKNNRIELQWDAPHHSAIRMATADDASFGHGSTRNVFHATEVARWGNNAEQVMIGVLSSIQDAPGTFVIKESTAFGVTGTFYRGWTDVEEGRGGGYENFFVGWLEDDTCNWETFESAWGPLPAEDDERWKSTPAEWLEDEDRLRSLGATWSQIAWRRQMIPAKCESSAPMFMEQYPATPKEAFLASGSNVFPLSIVDPELKRTAEIELLRPAPRYGLDPERTKFVPMRVGPLKVWKEPEPGHPYMVVADTASGENVSGDVSETNKLDYTNFRVTDRWTLEECAVWHGRKDPDLAAWDMAALGRWYNNALLVPETQHSSGIVLVNRLLKELSYSNIYRREVIDKATREPVAQSTEVNYKRYGWHTGPASGTTKGTMIAYLHTLIRERRLKIHEPEAWAELRTYVRSARGTMDAERGCHDDRVMAMAIGACILMLHPMSAPIDLTPKKAAPFLSMAWIQKKMDEGRAKSRAAGRYGGGFT